MAISDPRMQFTHLGPSGSILILTGPISTAVPERGNAPLKCVAVSRETPAESELIRNWDSMAGEPRDVRRTEITFHVKQPQARGTYRNFATTKLRTLFRQITCFT